MGGSERGQAELSLCYGGCCNLSLPVTGTIYQSCFVEFSFNPHGEGPLHGQKVLLPEDGLVSPIPVGAVGIRS